MANYKGRRINILKNVNGFVSCSIYDLVSDRVDNHVYNHVLDYVRIRVSSLVSRSLRKIKELE